MELINRLKDLVRTDRQELRTATGDLIVHLLRLATLEPPSDFLPVVEFAFLWGFDKVFTENWQGDQDVRDMLAEIAKTANVGAHEVISSVYLRHVKEKNLGGLPGGWYHHDLRRIIVALLANPNCGDIAGDLAVFYNKLNEETHKPSA